MQVQQVPFVGVSACEGAPDAHGEPGAASGILIRSGFSSGCCVNGVAILVAVSVISGLQLRDEVAALTAGAILGLVNAGAPGAGTPVGSPA